MAANPRDIDEYIAEFPPETQKILKQVRITIKNAAPEADETISYGMPTFNLHGHYLIYFAGYEKHIGIYPTPVGVRAFEKDLSQYKTGKGSVQLPLNRPMPYDLITKITEFRVRETLKRVADKKKTRS